MIGHEKLVSVMMCLFARMMAVLKTRYNIVDTTPLTHVRLSGSSPRSVGTGDERIFGARRLRSDDRLRARTEVFGRDLLWHTPRVGWDHALGARRGPRRADNRRCSFGQRRCLNARRRQGGPTASRRVRPDTSQHPEREFSERPTDRARGFWRSSCVPRDPFCCAPALTRAPTTRQSTSSGPFPRLSSSAHPRALAGGLMPVPCTARASWSSVAAFSSEGRASSRRRGALHGGFERVSLGRDVGSSPGVRVVRVPCDVLSRRLRAHVHADGARERSAGSSPPRVRAPVSPVVRRRRVRRGRRLRRHVRRPRRALRARHPGSLHPRVVDALARLGFDRATGINPAPSPRCSPAPTSSSPRAYGIGKTLSYLVPRRSRWSTTARARLFG